VAAAIGGPALYAADEREVYVSTAKQKRLLEAPIPGVDGKQITIIEAAFPPGWESERHYHSGPVYVYVIEGSFVVDEEGKARQTFRVGDLYQEPIGATVQARNQSMSEQARVLLVQIGGPGEPLMYKAR
jgi:quercetin dioxygenase-like cupin family protein